MHLLAGSFALGTRAIVKSLSSSSMVCNYACPSCVRADTWAKAARWVVTWLMPFFRWIRDSDVSAGMNNAQSSTTSPLHLLSTVVPLPFHHSCHIWRRPYPPAPLPPPTSSAPLMQKMASSLPLFSATGSTSFSTETINSHLPPQLDLGFAGFSVALCLETGSKCTHVW